MKMKFEEALKVYKEKNFNMAKVYVMSENSANSFDFTTPNGYLPAKEEWEAMKVIIDHFYKSVTDEQIEAQNDKNWNEILELTTKPGQKVKKKHPGYVYLIKADNGLYKIGITKNLKQRLDHFTAKLPYTPELIHSIKTSDSNELEKYFHERFAQKRKRGEWFDLSESDIEEVKAYVGC